MKDDQPILGHKLLDRSPDRVPADALLVGHLKLARQSRVCCQVRELLRLRLDERSPTRAGRSSRLHEWALVQPFRVIFPNRDQL